MYMGGRNADKIYFGKPVIYDLDNVHYMYPNEARLRNMTYGVAIHYDVEVDVYFYEEGAEKVKTVELKHILIWVSAAMTSVGISLSMARRNQSFAKNPGQTT